MKLLIKNGHIVDPANNIDEVLDILIENSKIVKVGKNIDNNACTVIDATNKMVLPGLIDMHVHLREPGREDKETVASGTNAALRGGVTSVLAMPNTSPVIDSKENIQLLRGIIEKSAHANVFICGAITKGRKGEELVDIAQLKKGGAVGISDDGDSVETPQLLIEALKIAKKENVAVICHCEDKSLAGQGVVNLGITSTRMGLRGISRESEYTRVGRDIELAEMAKAPIHIAHVSCKESVEIIASAKKRGVKVTCETAPHYFTLSEEAIWNFDTNMKINPPLRGKKDLEVILKGLKDGTIDVIASDHAPHTENEKDIEFDRAAFGAIGLETELALGITELVQKGILSWGDLIRKLAVNPAKILGISKGSLAKGQDADIVIVSDKDEWVVQKSNFVSRSKNTMFLDMKLNGIVDYTILQGEIVYKRKNRKSDNEISCKSRAGKTC